MNLHSIDIPGGYSGTVQITNGKLRLDRGGGVGGGYSFHTVIKFYHFCLLTPERVNIEFYLLRFPDGEWCDARNLNFPLLWGMDENLISQTKAEILKRNL